MKKSATKPSKKSFALQSFFVPPGKRAESLIKWKDVAGLTGLFDSVSRRKILAGWVIPATAVGLMSARPFRVRAERIDLNKSQSVPENLSVIFLSCSKS